LHESPALHATHDPPAQTMFVPHAVPLATIVAPLQLEPPDEQDVVPTWQRFPPGLQEDPDVQATHDPLLQTMLVPHAVPLATFTGSAHVDEPDEQDVIPLWHGLPPGLHATPAVHATHVPPLQTMFAPHAAPFGAFATPAHTDVPVAHEVVPVWQGFDPGLHGTPAVHATQPPLSQTSLVPHDVPLATFVAPVHVVVPVAHDVVALWQTLPPGLHAWPAVHVPHWPALHTWLLPQDVPSATWPVCVQTALPVEQETTPLRHELPPGVQAAPVAQEMQAPLLQTSLVPQGVPSAALTGLVQVDAPVAHEVDPVWQAFPPGPHDRPAVQATHLPPEHTLFVPQEVPSGAFEPVSVQTIAPLEHETVPTWQTLAEGAHEPPGVHGAHVPPAQ
jgi:hypothetical protein